jgi:microsomal dipeptidase-like Zn-dependent dipeptidase
LQVTISREGGSFAIDGISTEVKRALVIVAVFVSVLAMSGVFFAPTIVDRALNRVLSEPPYAVSARVQTLYDELFVVDLHGDPLLWDRDLNERTGHGSIDIPRLVEGNVGIQCFFIVSKSPYGQNIDRTVGDSDAITALAVLQGWPRRTWGSLLERALFQSKRLHEIAERSNGKLVVVKSKTDLRRYREARAQSRQVVAGILGVEGAQVLEADAENIDKLFNAGVRILAPTHFFDNEVGGSAHGVEKGGLTTLGRQMIAGMEARGIALDLAHASSALIDDALSIVTRPVIVSHTGVKGTCDNNRNLSDAQLKAIAATGGVIGIGYWNSAVCGDDATAIARAIRYTSDLVGIDHVALGSDFDGAVPVPFDTTGLALIAEALLNDGFSEAEVRKVMGENAVRLFEQTLPD